MVGYLVSLIISTAIYALFSLGLNLQWGYTGLLNFGHVAFMTVGAYTTVLLSLNEVPLAIATLMGGAVAALLGLILGTTTLRLREDYLSIVTIGASEVIRLIALNEEWLTRGSLGVANFPLPLGTITQPTIGSKIAMIALWTGIFGISGWNLWKWARRTSKSELAQSSTRESMPTPISPEPPAQAPRFLVSLAATGLGLLIYGIGISALYDYSYKAGLMLVVVTVVALTYWRLEVSVKAPWGRVLKSIREDEEVARALGKNVFWYKLQSLMLGGAIAGIAGAFYAWNLTFINPDGFIPLITFQAWIIVVLGGAGNNAGTILGAIIYWAYFSATRFLPEFLQALHSAIPLLPASIDDARLGAFRIMVIGLLLIILMMARPQGILGKKEELTLGR
ncbi:branched-chain amino acid ABC transporter permease [Phormidium sp. CLA17]|uniref:branched-chain amino acid ABC transporter permease n=1 Tax=Leptolyngbya sp. Cla-17 TaxID=2803751 RepID=UPI001490EB35|nr:branched-chain amino acid ABC transporter permease [Leptolyngbya sp. Cla-17]MBM0740611.1 branched-chain amino acid ABC transporter permease [Leptolyngbya sp. Cla-17]